MNESIYKLLNHENEAPDAEPLSDDKVNSIMKRFRQEREAKVSHNAPFGKAFIRYVIAAAAAALMCGTAVSAVNFGWLDKIFGESASIIENRRDSYSVKISNVNISRLSENRDSQAAYPKVTLDEFIGDGEKFFLTYTVDFGSEDTARGFDNCNFGMKEFTAGSGTKIDGSSIPTNELDRYGSRVSFFSVITADNGIKAGDSISLVIGGMDGYSGSIDNTVLSFDVVSVPETLVKTYTVRRDAIIGGEKYFVEKIELSPFGLKVIGRLYNDGCEAFMNAAEYSINMKDGSVKPLFEISAFGGSSVFAENPESAEALSFDHEAHFCQVVDLNDIESVSVGDLKFKL